ncbi:hypothetical protein OHO28_51345 [Streptomyces europaeiscabiei]|uniref:hypothetical protein n=1 Tax=Streptomyces europaeiscabiei TaxID=146819 RepID=UPI002E16F446
MVACGIPGGGVMAAPCVPVARQGAVAVGDAVRWRGSSYLVAALQGSSVHLLSHGADGEDAVVLLDALLGAPDFAQLASPDDSTGGRAVPAREGLASVALLEGLSPKAREEAEFWLDHVLEVHTGLPGFAAPGCEPRPGYDPARTTLRERYAFKAAELQAAHHRVSAATVERKRLAWLAEGVGAGRQTQTAGARQPRSRRRAGRAAAAAGVRPAEEEVHRNQVTAVRAAQEGLREEVQEGGGRAAAAVTGHVLPAAEASGDRVRQRQGHRPAAGKRRQPPAAAVHAGHGDRAG